MPRGTSWLNWMASQRIIPVIATTRNEKKAIELTIAFSVVFFTNTDPASVFRCICNTPHLSLDLFPTCAHGIATNHSYRYCREMTADRVKLITRQPIDERKALLDALKDFV
jgi:hypothetical protein